MIIIVTVYNSTNYGSFLQARALYEILSTYDEVRFLNSRQRKFLDFGFFKQIINALVFRFDCKYVVMKLQRLAFFKRNWSQLPSISLSEANELDNPHFVLGSDEIWDVSKKKNRIHLFWGAGLKGDVNSYAVSINNADSMQLESFDVKEYLSRMKMISVRDTYSQSVLSLFTKRPLKITLDPTFLLNSEQYLRHCTHKKLNYRYIALYLYTGNKKDIYEDTVKRFAAENDLKVVSVGNYVHWADVNFGSKDSGIVPFIYYLDAEYVITNTFHGTAFAINFNSKFVCFARNNKLKDLLRIFELENRDVCNRNYETISDILQSPIEYDKVNGIKDRMRAESWEFIKQFIQKCH